MQLLISVAGPAEARAALRGGADVIDAKDPWRGALGPVSVQRLAAIRAAVAGARPLSAAVGDATSEDAVAGSVAAALSVGVAFVRLGRGRARRGIVRRARRWPLRPGPRARALSRRRCRGRAGRGVRRGTDGPGFARSRGGPARPSRSGALSSSPDRAGGPPAARRR